MVAESDVEEHENEKDHGESDSLAISIHATIVVMTIRDAIVIEEAGWKWLGGVLVGDEESEVEEVASVGHGEMVMIYRDIYMIARRGK